MKQSLQALIVTVMVGCSDYELHSAPENVLAADTGLSDAGSSEGDSSLESYDPCDPYGDGWDIPPVGTARSDCIGIEGYAQSYAGTLLTQISYGDCDKNGLQPYWNVYNRDGSDYITNAVLLGSGDSWYCPSDFSVIGWVDYSGDNPEALSELSLEAKVWMLSAEERDSLRMLSEEEEENRLYDIHEPLSYALECNSNAIALDEDCTAFLY